MIFPSDNLGTASKPWAREITKQLSNIIDISTSNNINNTARDNQLNSSIIAASAAATAAQTAATKAQQAIDALGNLDQETSTYKINAANLTVGSLSGDRISGGTITGTIINTSASGTRVQLSSDRINFYDSNDSLVGRVLASGANTMSMISTAGGGVVFLDNGSISISGFMFVGGASFTSITNQGTYSGQGGISTDSTLTRTALATGASTTCTINGSGQFVRTTSSERYKQDINPLDVSIESILNIEPRSFRLKEEVEANPNSRYYAGFIAEELDALGLDVFVGYEKLPDGTSRPESVYYGELTAALVSVIKNLNARLEVLEAK